MSEKPLDPIRKTGHPEHECEVRLGAAHRILEAVPGNSGPPFSLGDMSYDKPTDELYAVRKRFYASAVWRHTRAAHLSKEPLCRMCLAKGIVNDGSKMPSGQDQPDKRRRVLVVDHITPWKGDLEAAKRGPFQTLCPDHHDHAKQVEDRRGYSPAVGPDGWPIDRRHPANR